MENNFKNFHGSCHCGAIEFEVKARNDEEIRACTCSMCERTGFIHLIVPNSRFNIIKGEENLTHYKFNTGVADHTFCKICGVKSFYVPRSNPDGMSVNVRCIDGYPDLPFKTVAPFNGKNWEEEKSISHLSQD